MLSFDILHVGKHLYYMQARLHHYNADTSSLLPICDGYYFLFAAFERFYCTERCFIRTLWFYVYT